MIATIITILIILFLLSVAAWILRGILSLGGGCLSFMFKNLLWLGGLILVLIVIFSLFAGN